MKLTERQKKELRHAALPLMRWLSTNCHPHATAIVDSERTELLEGLTVALHETHPQRRTEKTQ